MVRFPSFLSYSDLYCTIYTYVLFLFFQFLTYCVMDVFKNFSLWDGSYLIFVIYILGTSSVLLFSNPFRRPGKPPTYYIQEWGVGIISLSGRLGLEYLNISEVKGTHTGNNRQNFGSDTN